VIDAIKYPQLARMQEVQETSQAIGEFLDWLSEQRIDLCSIIPGTGHDRWAPITDGAEKLLARYFDIDLNAVERERRAVLAGVALPAPTEGKCGHCGMTVRLRWTHERDDTRCADLAHIAHVSGVSASDGQTFSATTPMVDGEPGNG
jgi:hypothetical protein